MFLKKNYLVITYEYDENINEWFFYNTYHIKEKKENIIENYWKKENVIIINIIEY